jgi:hypothetical protein
MPPKVLLITDAATTRAGWVLTALRLMGFTAERAYTYPSGSEIRLALPNAEHRLDIDDASLRNRLREYHAVLIGQPWENYSDTNTPISYTFRFLGWNSPQDPPFVYFGVHFATNRTSVSFPSDFPLLRPNRTILSSTAHKIGPDMFQAQTQTLRVRLTRENTECYLPIITDREPDDGIYVWRLHTGRHNALGSQGEVLAEVIGEDYVFDTTPICAYRYKNCYLFPRLVYSLDASAGAVNILRPQQAFWLLYALKCTGLAPRYALPIMMMLDDVQDIGSDTAPRFTGAPYVNDWLRNRLTTYEWYAKEFFPRTQVPLWAAITTGGRYGTDYIRQGAWNLFMRGRRSLSTNYDNTADEALDATGVQLAQQMLQLFVREQNRSMRFCWHDHRIMFNQTRNLSRHTDAGYPLAAPNDVPVAHGQMVRKGHISPPANAVEIEMDGEVYYDIAPTMSGSAAVVWYDPRSLHAARILVERNRAEMHALGFADGGVGGADRFQNAAGAHYGSPAVMQALYESGVRIVRSSIPAASWENTQTTLFIPIRGVWVWGSDTLDGLTENTMLNSYGLYDAANPTRSYVGSIVGLRDPGGDISSIWTTDPVRARLRAYRRLMGYLLDGYLSAAVYPQWMAFSHPPTLLGWCDPADPLRRFNAEDSVPSGSPGPYINMLLEFWLNFEVVYRVLRDYLTPATGELVIATRERWMESV